MIAVAKIGGRQSIVKQGDVIKVDKIDQEVGKNISLDVLLLSAEDGNDFQVGAPFVEGVVIEAKIIEHGRADKFRVFKISIFVKP